MVAHRLDPLHRVLQTGAEEILESGRGFGLAPDQQRVEPGHEVGGGGHGGDVALLLGPEVVLAAQRGSGDKGGAAVELGAQVPPEKIN